MRSFLAFDLGVSFHAIGATRVHLTMTWVVSFPILGPFGPRCAAQVNGSRMKKGKMMQELEAALNNAIPALMEFLPRGAASVEEPAAESVGVSEVETVI